MSELRWHPLLRQWVGVAAARQNRPQMPKDWCPFDPGSGKVPDHYDVHLYPNDFAALSPGFRSVRRHARACSARPARTAIAMWSYTRPITIACRRS